LLPDLASSDEHSEELGEFCGGKCGEGMAEGWERHTGMAQQQGQNSLRKQGDNDVTRENNVRKTHR
jgi:hypothetical protein